MNRIQELREEYDMKQTDLADRVGVAANTLSNYENGNRQPSFETIHKICKVFGVPMDYLLGYSEIRTYGVTEEEHALIRAYNAADPDRQEAVRVMLRPFWEAGTLSASGSGQGGNSHGAL